MTEYTIHFVGKSIREHLTAFYGMIEVVEASCISDAKHKISDKYHVYKWEYAEIGNESHGINCPSLDGAPVCKCGNTRLG
jgi:hypothetical protein